MTLEQLRIFVAVAERLHMTRASEALRLSQSAASAAVAALEERHATRLFDRVGRGLVLTEAGRAFLPEAKAVLLRAETAERVLEDLAGLRRGHILIAASQTVANYWLPQRLATFRARHPNVALELTATNTAHVAQAVLEGAADLGFVEGAVEAEGLARRTVERDRLVLYAAPDHPLVATPIDAESLRTASWAMREPGSGTRSALEQALAGHGVDPSKLHIVFELPSTEAVLAVVAAGGLLTAVSTLAAGPLEAMGRLRRLDFDLGERRFDLLTRKDRHLSHAAAAFMAEL